MTSFAGILYGTFCHARWGQTVGKWIFGVCVLDVSEVALRPWQAVKRDLVWLILTAAWVARQLGRHSYVPPSPGTLDFLTGLSAAWFALEVLTMLTNPRRRALHDYIAGSIVVRVVPLWRRAAG